MPHLQFEISKAITNEEKREFMQWVTQQYSEILETGTGHIGITLRTYASADLFLGRVTDQSQGIAFLNADIRKGRTPEQRRKFALQVMEEINRRWSVPQANMYVIYTEHGGEDFHLYEKVLDSWTDQEAQP